MTYVSRTAELEARIEGLESELEFERAVLTTVRHDRDWFCTAYFGALRANIDLIEENKQLKFEIEPLRALAETNKLLTGLNDTQAQTIEMYRAEVSSLKGVIARLKEAPSYDALVQDNLRLASEKKLERSTAIGWMNKYDALKQQLGRVRVLTSETLNATDGAQ